MDPVALAHEIARIPQRAAGSDAERRASLALAEALRSTGRRRRRTTKVVPFWVRPHRGPVMAFVAALAIAASVVSVEHAVTGVVLAGAALLGLLGDLSGRAPLVRRLTFERATQAVVSRGSGEGRVRLIVTAAVDTPRTGLLERGAPARAIGRVRRATRGVVPGPYGLFVLAIGLVLAGAVVRLAGVEGAWLGTLQLVPTVVCILAVGASLDQAAAVVPSEGANANASAAAVAIALVAALDARPPRNLVVDCVLAGAGGAHALGMRRWVARERRSGVRAEEVAVLHIAPCGRGTPVWWERDGLVLPLAMHPSLVGAARAAARDERHLGARAVRTASTSGARAARGAGWPALALGCLDDADVVPDLGTDGDSVSALDPAAVRATLELALAVVARVDAGLDT